jgi:hypothetical protein
MLKVSAEDQWSVLRDEQKYGPFGLGHLKDLAAQGRLLESDWIWKPGLAAWIAAGDVSGLFAEPAQIKTEPAQRNFKTRAKDEMKTFGLMFLYLWIVFGLLAVHESMILSQHQLSYQVHGLAIINALVFAKVMLVAEDLRLGHRLNDKPLIYSILYKSCLFGVALICFHIAEHILIGLWHGKAIAETIAEIGADRLGQIISGGTIATVALVPFFILREISRVMGADNFWSLFFRRRVS